MSTNVRTDNKNLVTQYGRATALQPADPVLLKPKGDPGVAPHFNTSVAINNAAGTVFNKGTKVAHRESYMGAGRHFPMVIVGRNIPLKDGDTGFLSWGKSLFIESRNAVMHAVDAGVNSLWQALPAGVRVAVENGAAVTGGLSTKHFGDAAAEDAEAMLDALKSTDTLIALAQTAVLMGVSAIPVVGQIAGGAAAVQRIKATIESVSSAAEEFKAMMERWSQQMSPAQLEAERKKLASFLLRVGISAVLAALGKAGLKLSKRAQGKANSEKKAGVEAGEGKGKPNATQCACATGRPVIIATGEKSLKQADFSLPGLVEINWMRSYRSGDVRVGWTGQGWSLAYAMELRLSAGGLILHDEGGRTVALPWVDVGAEHYDAYEQLTLRRPQVHAWQLVYKDGRVLDFQRLRDDQFSLPLAGWADRNGNALRFEYPDLPDDPFAAWRPLAIQAGERRLLLQWNQQGLLAQVSLRSPGELALQVLADYQYNAQGQLLAQRNAAGHQRLYGWQGQVLVSYTEADGAEHRADYDRYDSTGRVTRSYAAADGRGLSFEYLDRASATRVTDSLGRSTLYEYDDRRDIVATTGPDGVRIATPFDSNGHPRGLTDALGRETAYAFDRRGNLTDVVDAAGARTRIRYTPLDLPERIVDALGHEWQREYDERGNLRAHVDPLGRRTSYRHDDRGLPVQITDARGGHKRLQWDSVGNLLAYTDCSQRRSSFTYDKLGRLLTQTDALGQSTHYRWNEAGQLEVLTEVSGATHRYDWSAGGQLLAYTDPMGASTRWHYNPHGEPLERVDANGHVLRYEYDAAGRLCALVNENGEHTRFAYDIADQLTDEIGFDGRHQRYVYNVAGELTHLIEAGGSDQGPGKVTHFERDALGRLLRRITQDTEASYRYDPLGRLLEARNAAATIGFAYDPAGQLLSESQTLPGLEPRLLRHGYDELGNRIRTELPDQRTLHWLFYGSGHLHQINIETNGRHELISDIERDALHREVGRSQGRLASHYEHDPQGRLLKHRALRMGNTQQVALERSYQYDASGNLIQRQDSLRGEQRFRYDPTGRILQARGKVEEFFAFDPAGNLLAQRSGAQPAVRGNRLKVWQELRFEYDVHGNVVQRRKGAHEEAQLRWNAEHQLQEAEVTRHGVTQTTRYRYDALGRRVSKADAFGGTQFLWDGDLLLQSQRGARQALFIYEPHSFVPLATVQEGQTYWYQCDQIGAPLELTDAQGQVAWAAEYRVWGEAQLLATGTHGASGSRWGAHGEGRPTLEQPFRFQGQQFDEETGLHYNRFRYYDPAAARYVSQDPIGFVGGENFYQYGPSPLGWIDPSGLAKKLPKGNYSTHADRTAPAKVNGRSVINKCYAGKVYPAEHLPAEIRGKYPHGVPFNMQGFPDFSRYAVKTVNITPGASRGTDFSRSNVAAFGKGNPYGDGAPKINGTRYTWHHHQESGKMQLIPEDIHDAVKHTGGFAKHCE